MTEAALLALLVAVTNMGRKFRLTDDQIVTAQSLAWYSKERDIIGQGNDTSHAWYACLRVRKGRDLMGCETSSHDALWKAVQGSGMPDLSDRSPGPDRQAEDKEAWELLQNRLTANEKTVADLKIRELDNQAIADYLNLTAGRTSQIARRVWEKWQEGQE